MSEAAGVTFLSINTGRLHLISARSARQASLIRKRMRRGREKGVAGIMGGGGGWVWAGWTRGSGLTRDVASLPSLAAIVSSIVYAVYLCILAVKVNVDVVQTVAR